jgi:hypothetical protein
MSGDENLIGIAQIASTFAGFAALAGIVGRRAHASSRHDVERLRTVILVGVMVVATALLPTVVEGYGRDEATVWRVSSGLALIINWALGAAVAAFGKRSGLFEADRIYKWAGWVIEVPLELALLANVFGVLSAHAAGLYLTFLYLALIQAVIVFIQLVNSLFAGVDGGAPEEGR